MAHPALTPEAVKAIAHKIHVATNDGSIDREGINAGLAELTRLCDEPEPAAKPHHGKAAKEA